MILDTSANTYDLRVDFCILICQLHTESGMRFNNAKQIENYNFATTVPERTILGKFQHGIIGIVL